MRIGIFIGDHAPVIGGNHTFQDSILMAMEDSVSSHELYVLGYDSFNGRKLGSGVRTNVTYVSMEKPSILQRAISCWFNGVAYRGNVVRGSLDRMIKMHSIEMLWFLTHQIEVIDIPFIGTVLDIEHRVHPFFPEVSITGNKWDTREKFFNFMIPRATCVICGTEEGKRQIIHFYHPDPERVRVIPFFVPSFALDILNVDSDVAGEIGIERAYLLYPAQFWPHKNHVCLLNALKILVEDYGVDFQLVFSGDDKGNASYVEQQAAKLGVRDRVIFAGFVSQAELAGLYRNAFALVYPSFFGPDNLPPLEAFALGCPVIAADGAGAREQLGDAALLVDPKNEQEFCDAVLRLMNDPMLREELKEKGQKRVAELTPERYVARVLSFVDEFEPYRRCWSRTRTYVHT